MTDAADRMAEGESRVLGEAATEAREAKREAAELLWAGAKSFADAAAEAPYREHVRRFLERFASLGDEAVPTDALRKAREAARRAAEGSGDARQD